MPNYLQHGVCYADINAAKSDFISRIDGIEQRAIAIDELSKMSSQQLQVMFPDCLHAADWFSQLFGTLAFVVIICISITYIKRVAA